MKNRLTSGHTSFATRIVVATAINSLLFLSACSTQPESSSYYRSAQTQLTVYSTPSGSVNENNRYVGVTPVTFPLDYEQEVRLDTRNVTYWQTHPGLSVFLTLISFGIYLPFSMIPVDTQTSQVPLENYRSNHFVITIDAAGYGQWKQEVVANGEKTLYARAQLAKKAQLSHSQGPPLTPN